MLSCFLQPYGSQHISSILGLHMVAVVYYCRMRQILFYQGVERCVHVHCDSFYFRQILQVCLFKKLCKGSYRASRTNPEDVSHIKVHNTGCVSMAFVHCKLINGKMLRTVATFAKFLASRFESLVHNFLMDFRNCSPMDTGQIADCFNRHLMHKQNLDP